MKKKKELLNKQKNLEKMVWNWGLLSKRSEF